MIEVLTSTTSATALDGNSPTNQASISANITGLNWANGSTLWIKWNDYDDSESDGNYAIDNFSFSATATLSVKQNSISGLSVYPNPVSNCNLYIKSNSSEAKSVGIYDILGKEVLKTKTSSNAVNVSNLKRGTYIVIITEDDKADTRKGVRQIALLRHG